jgi:hypothetical protein
MKYPIEIGLAQREKLTVHQREHSDRLRDVPQQWRFTKETPFTAHTLGLIVVINGNVCAHPQRFQHQPHMDMNRSASKATANLTSRTDEVQT